MLYLKIGSNKSASNLDDKPSSLACRHTSLLASFILSESFVCICEGCLYCIASDIIDVDDVCIP
jgi:hypothetical protein